MKKNQGHKSSKIRSNKQKSSLYRLNGGGNSSKVICLECLKAYKHRNICCGQKTYSLGTRPRPPKINASKAQWRKFIDRFINPYPSLDDEQLNNIYKLKRKYNLSVHKITKSKIEKNESDSIIDHDIRNLITVSNFKDVEYYINGINQIRQRYNEIEAYDLKINELYYIVPYFVEDSYHIYLPKENNFKMLSVRIKATTTNTGKRILYYKTMNNNDLIPVIINVYDSTIRQSYSIFKDKRIATAFQTEILNYLYPLFKEHNISYLNNIKKMINIGYERTIKKIPEILI
jgi:hypothetical protein